MAIPAGARLLKYQEGAGNYELFRGTDWNSNRPFGGIILLFRLGSVKPSGFGWAAQFLVCKLLSFKEFLSKQASSSCIPAGPGKPGES